MIKFLSRLSIFKRLVISYILVFLVNASLSVMLLFDLSSIEEKIAKLKDQWFGGSYLFMSLESKIHDYRIMQTLHINTFVYEEMVGIETQIDACKVDIDKLFLDADRVVTNSAEKGILSEIKTKWKLYSDLTPNLISFSRNPSLKEGLYETINEAYKNHFQKIMSGLDNMLKSNKLSIYNITKQQENENKNSLYLSLLVLIISTIVSAFFIVLFAKSLVRPILILGEVARKISDGNEDIDVPDTSRNEIGLLYNSFKQMINANKSVRTQILEDGWIKTGLNELNEAMRGDQDVYMLSKNVISYLAKYLNAQIGAIYIYVQAKDILQLSGTYSFVMRKGLTNVIKPGEGLIGQVAIEKQMISICDVPAQYMMISSGLGQTPPKHIIALPFLYENELIGVIELGTLQKFSTKEMNFLEKVVENIAIVFKTAISNNKIKELLEESRKQASRLQAQQEALKATNEELEAQTQALKKSENALQVQQEALRSVNDQLEEKTKYLESQRLEISTKNIELEKARMDIENKAKELEITSKYKSEFLANMSHELRTPLNSLLILADHLLKNKENNLTKDQLDSVRIIHKSGSDLLTIINDILDLSKIEAGKMTFNVEKVLVMDILNNLKNTFTAGITNKGLEFNIQCHSEIPETIHTDIVRLEQVLKNLIANALKFTESGEITIMLYIPEIPELMQVKIQKENWLAIAVKDSGIGIPKEKHQQIFEAFQQGDGTTSRKYGGTGLGLSISKQIINNLGGHIRLKSEIGRGSVFTIYIPLVFEKNKVPKLSQIKPIEKEAPMLNAVSTSTELQMEKVILDDRNQLSFDKTILIYSKDKVLCTNLYAICKKNHFNCIMAEFTEQIIPFAQQYKTKAILIDISVNAQLCWNIIEKIAQTPQIKNLPVHVISVDPHEHDPYHRGAISLLSKPLSKEHLETAIGKIEDSTDVKIQNILVVEDDTDLRETLAKHIGNTNVIVSTASSGKAAIDLMNQQVFDCLILDIGLPDISGIELLNILNKDKKIKIPPIIVYTGSELSEQEKEQLQQYADSIILKGQKSMERLLDETCLFLHKIKDELTADLPSAILHHADKIFEEKKVLLVDDDMRNVFALSKILKEKGFNVSKAEDGQKALNIILSGEKFDIVLMDIMMPVMNGYEAIKAIRKNIEFKNLPIIALTAKAMMEDKEKCLSAGASDYLSKPVEVERLLSVMRVWLYK